jgi:organic radical activating enzyme
MKLRVNEIFYSLQGEGARAGRASIFIRLSDCNLRCDFCDTEFTSGRDMTIEEIREEVLKYPCNEIVWTGGEPTLQLTAEILREFSAGRGFIHCIETNGTGPIPEGIDFVSLSPKVAEHVVKKNVPECDEVRYVRAAGQAIPEPATKAKHHFVSPLAIGDKIDAAALQHCIALCLGNPVWRLSVQQHKMWGVR